MRTKRIGILTYFWSDNPGTFLQAYTVQKVLRETMPEARVELVNYRVKESMWRPNLQQITLGQWLRDYRRRRKFCVSRKQHLQLSGRKLTTRNRARAVEFIKALDYDAFFVGSDTILELQHYDGGVGAYWLPPSVDGVKIMISASCRSESYERLSPSQREILQESAAGFSLMGVRDVSTKELVGRLTGCNGQLRLIPDPTVCFDIDPDAAHRYFEKRNLPADTPIVAFNLTRQVQWRAELADLFRKKGYTVVGIGPTPCADYVLNDVTPFEWAGLFRFFDVVVTARFHASMFCLKNAAPFVAVVPDASYVSQMSSSKYHQLLEAFDLSENIVPDHGKVTASEVFEKLMRARATFDAEKVAGRLAAQRHEFMAFVNEAKSLCDV